MDISPNCFSIYHMVTFYYLFIYFNIPKNGRKFNSSHVLFHRLLGVEE